MKSAKAEPESAQPDGQNASEEKYRQLIMAAGRQLQQGNPAQTLKLLEQAAQMLGGRTTADILFLAAQAHLGLGNREMATQILGQLAKEYPQVDRLQLDYAAMLYSTGRDEEADAIFRDIRERKSLPKPVGRNVEKFLERIHRRKSLLIDYDFSVWKDDNVNNATEVDQVEIPLFGGLRFTVNEKPVEAWVARTGVNLLHRAPLRKDGSLRLNSRVGLARNTARNAQAHNRTWLNLSTGPQWFYLTEFADHRLPGYAGADIGYEKRWQGGDPYSGSAWIRFSARQSLPGHWALGGYVRYWDTQYSEGSSRLEPKGQAFNLYTERTFQSARVTAGWTFSTEHPDLSTQRWKSHQGMLAYETVFGLNWHVSAVAMLSEIRYKGAELLFQRRRKDQHRNLHVTFSNRALSWNGYLPELTLGLTETKSNIDLYDRDSLTLRLGLQKLF
ncbi:MAG: surface lipoprotein assembly modifier [Gammaproteobacteria bacterium]|nr:surface lipoprotein assembly modifier [Gammaproteobacteria bacterium]